MAERPSVWKDVVGGCFTDEDGVSVYWIEAEIGGRIVGSWQRVSDRHVRDTYPELFTHFMDTIVHSMEKEAQE